MATIAPSGNGTHPSTKANIRNNSGYVTGNFTAGVVKGLGIDKLADDLGQSFGSKVVANDGTGANTTDRVGVTGVVGANIAYDAPANQWIMKGVGVTTKLNNQNNNAIFFAASDWDGQTNRTMTGISGTLMYGSGELTSFEYNARPDGTIQPNLTKAGNAGVRSNFVRPSGSGSDAVTAADLFPTATVPGELTYRTGASMPVNSDYKAKNSYES